MFFEFVLRGSFVLTVCLPESSNGRHEKFNLLYAASRMISVQIQVNFEVLMLKRRLLDVDPAA
jgi:hypothetical protein